MKRRTDLVIAFSIALCVHGIAGVCAGNLLVLRRARLVPMFKEGESSVVLTLLPSRSIAPEPPETPEKKQHVLLEVSERKHEYFEEIRADNNADTLEKGVETFSAGITELRPRYPLGSRRRGEEGIVTVKVKVNAAGRAEKVEIKESSGYPALDREAVDAVKKARFAGQGGGAASGGEVVLSFRFKLIE